MMWFGCVGASSKARLCGWSNIQIDEACSLASGFGVSFVWVFATANNFPNELKGKKRKEKTLP